MKRILLALLAGLIATAASAQWPAYTTRGVGVTAIGATVSGGTANSVLFVGSTGLLAQSNTNFNYTETSGPKLCVGSTGTSAGLCAGYAGTYGNAALINSTRTPSATDYGIALGGSGWVTVNAVTGERVFVGVNNTVVLSVAASSITAAQPILAANGSAANVAYGFSAAVGTGFYRNSASGLEVAYNGTRQMQFGGGTAGLVSVVSTGGLTWSSGSDPSTSQDLYLLRGAANTLEQRNGTNAQVLRIYNTYTDASNYERAVIGFESNVLKVGARAAGTGTVRAIDIVGSGLTISAITPASSGTRYVCIDTAGAISSSASACSGT